MLDISRYNFSTNPVILPSLVLIDFDGAILAPGDILRATDCSSVYELLFSLGEIGGLFNHATTSQDETGFWGELMQVLVHNKLDRDVHTCTMRFEEFCTRFEGEMARRVESGVRAEGERVKELVERIVAMGEVQFPGEEMAREVLQRSGGLK